LNSDIFEECLKHYKSNFTLGEDWNSLANSFGYENGEVLRWSFKDERQRRGIPGKNKSITTTSPDGVVHITYPAPRVVICDIETLPGIGYFWGIFNENIGIDQIIQDTCLLGWAGKYLNESKMYSDILTSEEAKARDDKRLAISCWDFLSQADVIIGHNFVAFDDKMINTAYLKHNLPPLKHTVIDTLLIARQNFRFSSNKLKFINQKLGIRNKIDNSGFPLWSACSNGDSKALKTMQSYNEGDILATEELYYKVRPYVRNFNIALYNETTDYICPVCGSKNLTKEGFYYTSAGKWESVRCQDCKCISRKKTNLLSKDKKKSLLINS
jgi:hypothetical protein